MPFIQYKEINFRKKSLDLISRINQIIADERALGLDITLRGVYYKLVKANVIPNQQKAYDNIGSLINDARYAGLIDWKAISDITRNMKGNSHWASPASIIETCVWSYAIDKWYNQQYYVECWVEKDARVGPVEKVSREHDISYFSCRGYTSASEMWVAAMRLKRYKDKGRKPVIIHVGDHDPSGIDMSRDIQDRLETFMGGVTFERVALNYNQVEELGLPPNPAKLTDSRCAAYIDQFGPESWELDALDSQYLMDVIEDKILEYRDEDKWNEAVLKESTQKQSITHASKTWNIWVKYMDVRDDILLKGSKMLDTIVALINDAPDPDEADNKIGEKFMEDPFCYMDMTDIGDMLSWKGGEAEEKILERLNEDHDDDEVPVASTDAEFVYEFKESPLAYFKSYAAIARMLKAHDEGTYDQIKEELNLV